MSSSEHSFFQRKTDAQPQYRFKHRPQTRCSTLTSPAVQQISTAVITQEVNSHLYSVRNCRHHAGGQWPYSVSKSRHHAGGQHLYSIRNSRHHAEGQLPPVLCRSGTAVITQEVNMQPPVLGHEQPSSRRRSTCSLPYELMNSRRHTGGQHATSRTRS